MAISNARQIASLAENIKSVTDFGAIGDGVTDYSTEVQAAIDALVALGGGALHFAPGTYICEGLDWGDNVLLKAPSLGSVIIKVPNNSSSEIISNADQSVPTTRKKVGCENIIWDGNKANYNDAVAAGSAVSCNGVEIFYSRNCIYQNASGYGLAFQARIGQTFNEVQDDIYLENCQFNTNGDGTSFSADTFDGLDIKDCNRVTLVGCSSNGNSDKGIDIRGEDVTILGGTSRDNGTTGLGVAGNADSENLRSNIAVSGHHAHGNGADGFQFASGAVVPLADVRFSVNCCHSYENSARGVNIPAVGSDTVQITFGECQFYENTSHGIQVLGGDTVIINNTIIRGNSGNGVTTDIIGVQLSGCQVNVNTGYGIQELTNGQRTILTGSTVISNGLGTIDGNPNNRLQAINSFDHAVGSGNVIASAAILPITALGTYYAVTGTTSITSIANPRHGREITLQFTGVLTVTHGGPIHLDGGSNITTADRNVLSLVADGTNWFQKSFSANT